MSVLSVTLSLWDHLHDYIASFINDNVYILYMRSSRKWLQWIWLNNSETHLFNILSRTLLPTVADCSRVAAHVHWETRVVAVNPAFTFPPASNETSKEFWNKNKNIRESSTVSCLRWLLAVISLVVPIEYEWEHPLKPNIKYWS